MRRIGSAVDRAEISYWTFLAEANQVGYAPSGATSATNEFPIYEITDQRLLPEFVQTLLRTRYYQRAFRAITTGHSNRRRTQIADFEAIELAFPPEPEDQRRLIAGITQASGGIRAVEEALRRELHAFSSIIDGRGDEELPETTGD